MATYTKQNTRIARLQCDPVYTGTGNQPASVIIQSFLAASILQNDTVPTDVKGLFDWTNVNFDLLDANLSASTITAAGKTITYPQLAALLRQAILDRANAQGVS